MLVVIVVLVLLLILSIDSYDLNNAKLLDRTHDVSVAVNLSMTIEYNETLYQPSYDEVLSSLYGTNANIFHDHRLNDAYKLVDIKGYNGYGPMIHLGIMNNIVNAIRPKVVVELGVFRGSTTCKYSELLIIS